jgi:dipeptidyl aminopeptidase/acylaminoacyl peptidase
VPRVAVFDDLTAYYAVPRLSGLRLSPDGRRLVVTSATLNDDGNAYVNSLWEVDPAGERQARRLTFSDKGESGAAFLPDGSLVFVSQRGSDDEPAALWLLDAAGGEARKVLSRPGVVAGPVAARDTATVVVTAETLPGATDAKSDEAARKKRKDLKVSAVLHDTSPVRFWDHDLGPGELRLVVAALDVDTAAGTAAEATPVDLTPMPGRALDEQQFDLTPDGRTVVTGWAVADEPGYPRPQLVALDTATGERRVLADDRYVRYGSPRVSHDGRYVACLRMAEPTFNEAPSPGVWVVDLASGTGRPVGAAADLWPDSVEWSHDDAALYVTSDHQGHHPIFRFGFDDDTVTQVTATGHFTDVAVSPDGAWLYALRDAVDSPPRPVRLDARGERVDPQVLLAPGGIDVPGRLEEMTVVVDDGSSVHAWLALPEGASPATPAPLLLWIHGGPLGSWNAWAWRWNPWLMVAKGYAVVLPDPALSTGYGRSMIQRGWGQWGGTPYTDLMSVTDEVVKRDDIDETRTAAMGGSYGGYLANWVAGHTDRFRCIVTHASLWALDQFQGTTDNPAYWAREWGLPDDRAERYEQWSPHRCVADIRTPMLVIHGDRDYRVPISEGLRLWWDLQRYGVESKYLYYPDEGHWVLGPGNARVWYETVWAWLATHVLGAPWSRPELV